MKQSEKKVLSVRQFTSEVEEFAIENPSVIRKIVDESEWGKRRERNTQVSQSHASLYDAINSQK